MSLTRLNMVMWLSVFRLSSLMWVITSFREQIALDNKSWSRCVLGVSFRMSENKKEIFLLFIHLSLNVVLTKIKAKKYRLEEEEYWASVEPVESRARSVSDGHIRVGFVRSWGTHEISACFDRTRLSPLLFFHRSSKTADKFWEVHRPFERDKSFQILKNSIHFEKRNKQTKSTNVVQINLANWDRLFVQHNSIG